MAAELLPDALWAEIAPLLPAHEPSPSIDGGRPQLSDRAALTGNLFVLSYAIPWLKLPRELGCGSGRTCLRRLEEWQAAGVWEALQRRLLAKLEYADRNDWSRAVVDAASVPSPLGGDDTGPNPTDRGKRGTKHHLLVDRNGLPLSVMLSGANVHDSQRFTPLIDALPPVTGKRGRPRCRPAKLHADKGYDFPFCRAYLRRRGIVPRIARRGVESRERLRRHRWVVERTLSWLHRFRRLRNRYDRRAAFHFAFLRIACAIILWRTL